MKPTFRFIKILAGMIVLLLLSCITVPMKHPIVRRVPPPMPPAPPLALKTLKVARPRLFAMPAFRVPMVSSNYAVVGAPYPVLAWNPVTNADGYALEYGIASGNYLWRIDVGAKTNAPAAIPLGGFTYYFAAVSYKITHTNVVAGKTNVVRTVELSSKPSNEVTWQAPCPTNIIQGPIVTNGQWVLAINVTNSGWLLSSPTALRGTFTNFLPLTNGVNILSGVVKSNQFFWSKTP